MCFSELHAVDLDRILVVDDEVHLTNLWRLILECTGRYTVREENRGERVLQTARKFRPDLIFLDRQLIDIEGGEVAAKLRADPEFKTIPIVFVTGSVTQEEAALHAILGGALTLAKPFSSEALPHLAGVVLDKHRRDRGQRAPRGEFQSPTSASGVCPLTSDVCLSAPPFPP